MFLAEQSQKWQRFQRVEIDSGHLTAKADFIALLGLQLDPIISNKVDVRTEY
jgi:hypothetical protein